MPAPDGKKLTDVADRMISFEEAIQIHEILILKFGA
jgi:hypothetical protein